MDLTLLPACCSIIGSKNCRFLEIRCNVYCFLLCQCHRRNLDGPVSNKFWNETIWDHTCQCVHLSSILEEVGFCPLPILWCKLAFRKIENPHQMCILSRLETSYFGVFSKEKLNSILLEEGRRLTLAILPEVV